MSFFGFDATLPKERSDQNTSKSFFASERDPFALQGDGASLGTTDDVLDFEDTYDGLGNQLNETGDTFNDDTFGGGASVGKDFDFSGHTADIRPTLQEEQVLHYARQPAPYAPAPPQQHQQQHQHQQHYQPTYQKPASKTGYESYHQPGYIPQLEASASLWGLPAKKGPDTTGQAQPQPAASASMKMMSLEEVEAAMRSTTAQKSAHPTSHAGLLNSTTGAPFPQQPNYQPSPHAGHQQPQQYQHGHPPQRVSPIPQPQAMHEPHPGVPQQSRQPMQILQHESAKLQQPEQPTQAQQFPMQNTQQQLRTQPAAGPHARSISINGQPMLNPQLMAGLPEAERRKFIDDEAKRAKRNHKIFLLSKNNGLMTPQDKNFITRIQLQQLVTASGGLEEKGSESQLAEDFYYQVHVQIRGAPRQHPNQPLSQFAQTYLSQTGGRYGHGRAHRQRGGDNHVQRMEQQVQRAVEAAKARPKNKQLTVQGSLGKIAFSNSKTPRPLLNFKRLEQEARAGHTIRQKLSGADKKAALRDIEKVYTMLMAMEDHERRIPPPPTEESNPGAIQQHIEWRQKAQELNAAIWKNLKVLEPVEPNSQAPHPFIAILSHDKGKKLMPRIFRHLDDQQRLSILTLITLHLSNLDVVRLAYPNPEDPKLSPAVKEAVETFSQAVMPPLFSVVNEAPLSIVSGLIGLLLDRVNVQYISRTKIGVSMLTMLISRVELIKQQPGASASDDDWANFNQLYGKLFDVVEPVLPHIFSTDSVSASEDVHVWQFLAAMGVGASPDQQQRLVLGVKDRVMDTVAVSKTLPAEMSNRKLGEVNLFMRAIGLDVELLG